MSAGETRTDVYEVLDSGGARVALETSVLSPAPDGARHRVRFKREDSETDDWSITVDADAAGEVRALSARAGSGQGSFDWERPARPSPRERNMLFPTVASDTLLLRRCGLRSSGEARLDVLEFDPTRNMACAPSLRLVERRGEESRMFAVGRRRAALYRVVDSLERTSHLWVNEAGDVVEKREHDGRVWRLLPEAHRLDKKRLLEESPVFCMMPWTHLYVPTDGRVRPCCVSEESGAVGSLRESPLEDIWNSAAMRAIRRDMLAGKPVAACTRCYEMERVGMGSTRRSQNANFEHHFSVVDATAPDGSAGPVNMAYLDVRFSNLCNLKCRSCGLGSSSAWYDDHVALGEAVSGGRLIAPLDDAQALWRQIEPRLPCVERIYFAGGEPLVMDEHYRILRALLAMGRTDVHLSYSTNFSLLTYKGQDVAELWDRFREVEVYASLDGMERQAEYLRKNQDWRGVLLNRERLRRAAPRVKFFLKPTLTALNVLHLPDFHRRWLEEGLVDVGRTHLTIAVDPEAYTIQILPPHLKERVARRYERHIEEALKPRGAVIEEGLFRSALDFMRSRDRSPLLPEFRRLTRALDALRGEDFEAVFPELADLVRA